MNYASKLKASGGGYARNAGKRWRYEDERELRELARRGVPLQRISLKLGRPEGAIRTKASALHLELVEAPESVPVARPALKPRKLQVGPASIAPFAREARQLELFN
ncbi:hypothetical protein [Glycocaulis sp.]|uniref:hypothetical protein n=1 Tax=Glycocaulis sp. TaxID=1969725 RepID=UPI003D20797F